MNGELEHHSFGAASGCSIGFKRRIGNPYYLGSEDADRLACLGMGIADAYIKC